MTKKIIIALALIGLVSTIGFLGYSKYVELSTTKANALQAIPTNAALIIKSENWTKSWSELENSALWKQITKGEKWGALKVDLNKTERTILQSESLKKLLKKQEVYLSLHSSTQDYDLLLASSFSTPDVLQLLTKNFIKEDLINREYDGVSIYQLANSNWSFCIHHGIVFFSSSPLLVEHSIRQLNNKLSLLENLSFQKVQKTESNFADAHIYINYTELSKLLGENSTINSSAKKQMRRWAEWAELDLKVKENTLLLSGFTLAQDSSANFLNALNGQVPQNILMDAVLPSNTQTMGILGISDFRAYYEKYKEFLAKHNNLYEHNKWLQERNASYNINLENTFAAFIGNELGHISTFTASGNTEHFTLIKAIEESVSMLSHLNESITENPYTETHRGFELKQLHIPNALPKLLGPLFNKTSENYFSWVDGYLVFANSPTGLKTFLNNYLSRKTLANNIYYQNYTEHISAKCNYLFYTNPALGNWSENLSGDWKDYVVQEDWSHINAFAYQLSANSELLYNNTVLHYEPNMRDESQLLWSVSLGSTFNMQPQFITNHYTKLKEVLVQDDAHILHLISTSGKEIWKRKLGGKILGKIHQIDYYKNNKLQVLFNTADSLYLLDRNGNNVDDFPVKLESRATAGHTLLDYDSSRKYRILIPSEDKMVYNYNKEGDLVKGWKFKSMPERISQPLQYHLQNGKDYIYAIDNAGNGKIVGRSGKQRIDLGTLPLADAFYIDQQHGYVYTTDAHANVWLTDLKGNQTKIKTNTLANPHYFVAANINKDELTELMIAESSFHCYQLEAELFSADIQAEQAPSLFRFDNETVIGMNNGDNIYLLKSNGNLYPGMPLYGQGLFNCTDTDKDGRLNLVVGSGDLLYNYSLE